MYVARATSWDSLSLSTAEWDRLAGNRFFLTWTWLDCWWRHYAAAGRQELYTLVVYDDAGRPIGAAPWYLERAGGGRGIVRFLGSGEVCSDYQTLLSLPGHEREVADAIAEWLTDDRPTVADWLTGQHRDRWSCLEFPGIEQRDPAMNRLLEQLKARGCLLHRAPGQNCWRIPLPSSWEAYLKLLSKNRRSMVRKALAKLDDCQHSHCHAVTNADNFVRGWNILVDLHQRRWRSRGQPGCFASARFATFHRDVARRLLERGELRLVWLEWEGRPVSVEYQFLHHGVVYGYQSGIEPAALDLEPGRTAQAASHRWAIEQGYHAVDYLRGDESYKRNWRAEAAPTWDLRVVAPRAVARVGHGVWLARRSVKSWIKSGLRLAREQSSRISSESR